MKLIQSQQIEAVHVFTVNGNIEDVKNSVNKYFIDNGYKLESGTTESGEYGIGNDILRILLGAMVKRYKFGITIRPNHEYIQVDLSKAMTGVSGGAIGYAKLNSEFEKVKKELDLILNQD